MKKQIGLGLLLAVSAHARTEAMQGLRDRFSQARSVLSESSLTEDLESAVWVCLQHSAIEGSNHSSYFVRKYSNFAGVVTSEASFDEDFRNFMPATFIATAEGFVGSQYFVTDRYVVEGAEGTVHVRRHGKYLLEEWTLDRPAGRGYPLVITHGPIMPGDSGAFSNRVLASAVSDSGRVAFLYAACQLKAQSAAE